MYFEATSELEHLIYQDIFVYIKSSTTQMSSTTSVSSRECLENKRLYHIPISSLNS